MAKPDTFALVSTFSAAINAALATEFGIAAPFQDNPQTGESFVIWVPGQCRREDYNQVAVDGEVWFIKGYDSFTALTSEQIGLSLWLEHAFPTVRDGLIAGLAAAARHSFMSFSAGSYGGGGEESPTVLPTISSKQYGAKQNAPWCLTLKVPCYLLLAVKRCY